MFRIKAGDYEYAVVFSNNSVQRLTPSGVETIDQTRALIHRYEHGGQDPVGGEIGFAYKAPNAANDEWEGRMWALSRACEGLNDDAASGAIYDAFWSARLQEEALDAAWDEAELRGEISRARRDFLKLYEDARTLRAHIIEMESR